MAIENGGTRELEMGLGLQVLEVPAPVSAPGGKTRVELSAEGRVLCETQLNLTASPLATPADYVDIFRGTAHSRWMIAPGPWLPFSMVKISPDNQTAGWCAGYEYSIESVDCFSHVHEWLMAGLGMMPTLGPLRTHRGSTAPGTARASTRRRSAAALASTRSCSRTPAFTWRSRRPDAPASSNTLSPPAMRRG